MKTSKELPLIFYNHSGIGVVKFEIDNQENKMLGLNILDFDYNLINLPIKCLDQKVVELIKNHIEKYGIEISMIGLFCRKIDNFRNMKIRFKNNVEDCFDYYSPIKKNVLYILHFFDIHKKDQLFIEIPPKTKLGLILYLGEVKDKQKVEWEKLLGYDKIINQKL